MNELRLRRLCRSDLAELLRWRSNPATANLFDSKVVYDFDKQIAWFETLSTADYHLILSDESNCPLVYLGNKVEPSKRLYSTIISRPESQRVGHAARALVTSLDHLFLERGFNRFYGISACSNPALAPILRFTTAEGTLRQHFCIDDHFVDGVIFSILREEWIADCRSQIERVRCEIE